MRYFEEQKEWDAIVQRVVGPDAVLISTSTQSSDCRVYKSSKAVYKMRRVTAASCRHRVNWLEDEFVILQRLSSIKEVPAVRDYQRLGDWEIIEMDSLPDLPRHDPTFGMPREPLRDFLAVARLTRKINSLGFSHGDLRIQNAGRNVEGGLSVFDFDQAKAANPLRCMLRDFFGFAAGADAGKVSLLDRSCDVQGVRILTRTIRALRRAAGASIRRGNNINNGTSPMAARAALQRDSQLALLAQAWELAARSDASAPGVHLAYYSLDVGGINFPGERPWIQRWHNIRAKADFRGKRFLELGCNLGLLSIHARLSGASQCLAVDRDSDILQAATMAAKGFGADVQFRQLTLDSIEQWDVTPEQFDIASALSVVHWVKNREAVWSFLSRFRELLYEGHESGDEGEQTLRNAGFRKVVRLGSTERNRQMFLALRD